MNKEKQRPTMKINKNPLMTSLVVLVFVIQLASPLVVHADGDVPPPAEDTTEETPPPETAETETDATVTEPQAEENADPASLDPTAAPLETDDPIPQEAPDETESLPPDEATQSATIAETPEPTESAPDSDEPTLEESTEIEEPTLAEILPDLPEGTQVVVLDGNGQPEPLATQAAAEIIAVGDPVWCPEGQAPTPGVNGCSEARDTLNQLLSDQGAYIDNQLVNGTIWITSGAVGDVFAITIDGSSYSNWDNYALTFQGGWSGTPGDTTIGANSIFSVPISIKHWNNTVTINNITVSNATGNGLTIQTSYDAVKINDSIFTENTQSGAHIESSHLTIANSTNSKNGGSGVWLDMNMDVTIIDSFFTENTGRGAFIGDSSAVDINHSTFSGNGDDGAYINEVSYDVTISNSEFNGNGFISGNFREGVHINDTNNVTISNSTFNENYYPGVHIENTRHNVTISNSTVNKNFWWDGAYIKSADDVTVTNSTFNENDENGITVGNANNLTISDTTVSGNRDVGASIANINNVFISGSTFVGNGDFGVNFASPNGVIKDSLFKNNTTGIYASAIELTLDCITYENNGDDFSSSGNVKVTEIPCKTDPDDEPTTPAQPIIVIPVPPDTDTIEFPMDCSLHTLYISMWPSGDWVQVACQDNAIARITRMDNTSLPELPAGFQYVSAFDVQIIKNGVQHQILLANGYIVASFMSRDENPQYDILYWDETNGEWLVLKEYQMNPNGTSVVFSLDSSNPDDLRKILKGVYLANTDFPPHAEVTVNFTGTLVLVQR